MKNNKILAIVLISLIVLGAIYKFNTTGFASSGTGTCVIWPNTNVPDKVTLGQGISNNDKICDVRFNGCGGCLQACSSSIKVNDQYGCPTCGNDGYCNPLCGGSDPDCSPPEVCGNGILEGTEQCDDGNIFNGDGCSSACQIQPSCNYNQFCEPWNGESANNCQDCQVTCNYNQFCESWNGETANNCQDCQTCKSDSQFCSQSGECCSGYCRTVFTPAVCATSFCGDNVCEGLEDQFTCSADCGGGSSAICGNGLCESGEDYYNCDIDCGVRYCGDNVCDSDLGENSVSCSHDCSDSGGGSCNNDGMCLPPEDGVNCPNDCGTCKKNGAGCGSSSECCSGLTCGMMAMCEPI